MQKVLEDVATLLMYKGPTISELISDTNMMGKKINIDQHDKGITLNISYTTAYQTKIVDQYYFNKEQHLIKQILKINRKEHVIFHKFQEANELLHLIENNNCLTFAG